MSLFRSFPGHFVIPVLVTTSTSLGSTAVLTNTVATDFGFQAAVLKLCADAAGPAYVRLDGQVASTADFAVSTGDGLIDWYDLGTGLSGVSITATSTGLKVRLGAWG